MELQKLSSTAKKLNVFFKVMQRIVLVAIIVMFCLLTVLSIANAVNPNVIIGTDLNKVDIGPVSFELAQVHTPSNATILGYAWVCAVLGAACGAVIWFGFGLIRKILSPMAEGSPFHPDTAKYLKKLAWLSLVLGIAQNVGGLVESLFALRSFGLDRLMESGVIRSVTVNYTLELGFIVVFFILLLMSYIFSYGAQLQQLSDETL